MSFVSKYAPALQFRDFRLLWIGEFISGAGTQMFYVTLNWQIYLITHSALALGMIGLARVLPIVGLSLLGGNFADVHNRKKILLITQSIMAICSFVLAVLTYTNRITASSMYLLTALVAASVAFDLPARQAFVPNLVDKKYLANALSIYSILWDVANIIGPAIAGILIAGIGVGNVYLFDCLSTLTVILALFLMHNSGNPTGEIADISLHSIKEGITFVLSKTILWSTMLLDFFSTFFSSAMALLPIFAKDILHVGPQGFGLLYAAPSIGAVGASLFMARYAHEIKRMGHVLLWAVMCYAFATVTFGLSKFYMLSFFALALVGVSDTVSMIIRQTIRQMITPDSLRGRMSSVMMIFFMGGPQLGEFEAGALAAVIGAPLSVVVGGVGTMVVVIFMAIAIPHLRRYQDK